MSSAKIAISINHNLLRKVDYFVKHDVFKNRSQAIQTAVQEIIDHLEHRRLATECTKLNAKLEQKMADEGLTQDSEEWPEY